MKKICVFVVPLFLAGGLATAFGADSVRLDGVAAYVNEHVVTVGELQSAMGPITQRLRTKFRGKELADKVRDAYRDAVNMQIDRYLILDAYKMQQGRIPEWVVDQRIDQIVREEFKGERAALMDALSRDKQAFDLWRTEILDFIIVSSMKSSAIGQNIKVSPEAIREYYQKHKGQFTKTNQVRIRMIVLRQGDDAEGGQKQRVELEQRLGAGEDFSALAGKFSKGRKADQGGDWGWMSADDLQPDLAKAVAALQPGGVSAPIEIAEETYFVKLEERRGDTVVPLEEAQSEIDLELRKTEAEKLYRSWIARLKEKAYVKIVQPDISESDSL